MERWLSYKGTCHVILLAKLHDMYLYKTDNFFHINHYLKSVSKVALLHRFYFISLNMKKCTFWYVCPAKTQISLHIWAVWSVFIVCIKKLCIHGYPNAPSEDFDQTARMHRMSWIFTGCMPEGTFFNIAAHVYISYLLYCPFNIFRKVFFCLVLYTEEVNLQTFLMI